METFRKEEPPIEEVKLDHETTSNKPFSTYQ